MKFQKTENQAFTEVMVGMNKVSIGTQKTSVATMMEV